MTTATPHNGLTIGVRMMDRDHREIAEVLDEIKIQLATGKAQSTTERLIGDLARATRSHYILEEGIMAAANYPGMALHRLRHQWMMEQLKAVVPQSRRRNFALNLALLQLFSESHSDHVHTDDLRYGMWLNGAAH